MRFHYGDAIGSVMNTLHFLKERVETLRFSVMLSTITPTPSSVILVSSRNKCFNVDLWLNKCANIGQNVSSILSFLLKFSLLSCTSRFTKAFTSFMIICRSKFEFYRLSSLIDLWILRYLRIASILKISVPLKSKAVWCFSFCYSTIGIMISLISRFNVSSISTSCRVVKANATLSL